MSNYSKRIGISVFLSVVILFSCIKIPDKGTYITPQGSASISDGTEDMTALELIKAIKTNIQHSILHREGRKGIGEKSFADIFIPIVEIFLFPLIICGIMIHFRHRFIIKIWKVIRYIHRLDGKKGSIIFCMN